MYIPVSKTRSVSFFARALFLLLVTSCFWLQIATAQDAAGLRGDPDAIADAEAMVEAMGGLAIWRELQSVHFVHEWDIYARPDIYLENELLDLTGPRSYVTMESEIYNRVRAYSPEHRYWNIVNGEFSYAGDEIHGWILLNTRKEPVIWATTQYSYSFGPLKRFGSLRVPDWAMTGGGRVRYQMVSLTGSNQRPDSTLFVPPAEYRIEE